jgi:DNA topoisomerase VI subunit B
LISSGGRRLIPPTPRYGQHIKRYLQQLAIITPYAAFSFSFVPAVSSAKAVSFSYPRRSDNMPEESREIAHHPSSVNNLLVQQIIDVSKQKTLLNFLLNDFSGIRRAVANRVITELSNGDEDWSADMSPKEIDPKQITRLCQILTSVKEFAPPDGKCLSPAGEYNMRLGIEQMYEQARASEESASEESASEESASEESVSEESVRERRERERAKRARAKRARAKRARAKRARAKRARAKRA